MSDALLMVGHGSRDPEGAREFLLLGRMLADRRSMIPTSFAFLEFSSPTIQQAIEELLKAGARRIVCQPGMLFSSRHVKNDLPRELHAAKLRWPHAEFILSDALDVHDKLLELCCARWGDALRDRPACPAGDTMLLLAGRGSIDRDALAKFEWIADRLRKAYGVGRVQTCFSGLASPLLEDALEKAVQTEFRRIVVQPYFMFTGVLVKRVRSVTELAGRRYANKEIFATHHLGVNSLLADAFEERIEAAYSNLC